MKYIVYKQDKGLQKQFIIQKGRFLLPNSSNHTSIPECLYQSGDYCFKKTISLNTLECFHCLIRKIIIQLEKVLI